MGTIKDLLSGISKARMLLFTRTLTNGFVGLSFSKNFSGIFG
jgi:hypothetical protein